MALFTYIRPRLPWLDATSGSPPYFLSAVDTDGHVMISLYVPDLNDDLNSYDETYESSMAGNRFPGGFKYMTYDGKSVGGLLSTPPPGNDFLITNLTVF